jgi:ABC-type antimicrobial peptide transport system ATPase subunit
MEPLEQVTVLMTLMRRLVQVMDHERAILSSMRLDALPDLQDEKVALAEAYEIEVARLRCRPETLGGLDTHVRAQLHDAMCGFQESVAINLHALTAARDSVDRVLCNITESLARGAKTLTNLAHGETGEAPTGAQVISVAFDRRL